MFHSNRRYRHGVFEDNPFDLERLSQLLRGRRRGGRPEPWSSEDLDDEDFPSDFEGRGRRRAMGLGLGGRHRMMRADLDRREVERALGRERGLRDGQNTRALALRIPLRASEPQIDLDEAFLFPQDLLHLTVRVRRHDDGGDVFRAAVPSSLTAAEILTAVGLRSHAGYRVLVAWRSVSLQEELPLDSRLASLIRRTEREPSHLYIERRRH